MKDRIRKIMEAQHMSQQEFAQYIELSPASLSSVFNGRTRPTLNIVEAIKRKFPNINTEWLMFGNGEMYPRDDASTSGHEQEKSNVTEQVLDFGSEESPTLHTSAASLHSNGAVALKQVRAEAKREDLNYIDKPQRRITEIRVFYDDLTFESFMPSKK